MRLDPGVADGRSSPTAVSAGDRERGHRRAASYSRPIIAAALAVEVDVRLAAEVDGEGG